jgi:hypothetical protein
MSIKIITSAVINKSINQVFDHIISIDLAHIFRKHKYLPAVVKTNEKEKWKLAIYN